MDETFRIEVEALSQALDQLDYFGVLKLPQDAAPADVRAAYHRESRAFHPDRYAADPDVRTRELVGRIYRRINEAYTVLRDDVRRRKYLADINGPDRARKLRFTDADEFEVKEAQKRKVEEQMGQTPNGRRLFAAALADIQAGRWDAAARALQVALTYEPQNARFREQLAAVEKQRPRGGMTIK